LQRRILTAGQEQTLAALKAVEFPPHTYLAGGTAVALHLGHRRSFDFDLFCPEFDDPGLLAIRLADALPEFQLVQSASGTLVGRAADSGLSLFRYPYPLLGRATETGLPWPLAGTMDLGAMKVAAIGDRGRRRDFVDLWFLCRAGLRLDDILAAFITKFGTVRGHAYHLLRALTWFEDAEPDPMPEMLVPCDWPSIRRFFTEEARRLLREWPEPEA
jgi:hypothetical protein